MGLFKKSLKKVYSPTYLILISIAIIPAVWKFFEILFVSGFDNAINILAQFALLEIIFKVFKETIITPFYKSIDAKLAKTDKSLQKKILLFVTIASILFTAIVIMFMPHIMNISEIPSGILKQTKIFLYLCAVASMFSIIQEYLFAFNLISKNKSKLFIYTMLNSVGLIILGFIFASKIMLRLSATGIAIAQIIINLITIFYFTFDLFFKNKKLQNDLPNQSLTPNANPSKNFNLKGYLKLVPLSFGETLIRNVAYYFMILVLLNLLNNQDLYYVANNYIWSIMLVPTMAQNNLIKQDVSNDNNASLKPYVYNTLVILGLWAFLIPLSYVIFRFGMQLQNATEVFLTLLKLLPGYIFFVFDAVIETSFIAKGKLIIPFLQTLLTNGIIYLGAFILYLTNIWTPTFNGIIILFNLGVIFSSTFTFFAYIIINRRKIIISK